MEVRKLDGNGETESDSSFRSYFPIVILCQFFWQLAFAAVIKGDLGAGRLAFIPIGFTITPAYRFIFFSANLGYCLA